MFKGPSVKPRQLFFYTGVQLNAKLCCSAGTLKPEDFTLYLCSEVLKHQGDLSQVTVNVANRPLPDPPTWYLFVSMENLEPLRS